MVNTTGWRGLGGTSKKEANREELLQQIQADRVARSEQRARNKAALCIQSHWRSTVARKRLQQQLIQQWHASFANAAAQPNQLVPITQLRVAVQWLIMALVPFGSSRTHRLFSDGVNNYLNLGANCASAPECRNTAETAMVRGTFALLLRSIASKSPEHNFTSDAIGSEAQAWLLQSVRLCQLCCLVLVADGNIADPVLDAAAARLLQLLTCSAHWGTADKGGSSGGSSDQAAAGSTDTNAVVGHGSEVNGCSVQEAAAAGVLAGLLAQPMPLVQAARRLVQCSSRLAQQKAADGSDKSGSSLLQTGPVLAASLQRVLGVCMALLESASSRPDPQQQQQHFAQQFVLLVLTAPGLSVEAPAVIKARLAQHKVMHQILEATTWLAGSGQLRGLAALHCLANIAQLLTGCSPVDSRQQRAQPALQASQYLDDHATAVVYCNTAMQLLSSASSMKLNSKQQKTSSRCSSVAGRMQPQQVSCQANDGDSAAEAAAVVRDGLWMLATQQHIVQLMRVLTASSQEGMAVWAAYCTHLLQDGTKLRTAASRVGSHSSSEDDQAATSSAGSNDQLSSSVLNVLAFAPGILPNMWRWLAVAAGLPLEAPLQASRGLDIAAVAAGPQGLSKPVVLVMGLFCRSLAQLLQVLDDADLHKHQTPFTLGTSRAIASTLNSLLFHSAFPQQPHQQRTLQQQSQDLSVQLLPSSVAYGMGLLTQYAPVVLRGYYERDCRQKFCQPRLWTEPYANLMAGLEAQQQQQQQGNGALATTAAVVQALLVGVGMMEANEDNADDSTQATSAPTRLAGGVATNASSSGVPGLRTGALLLLLRSAPQCVPFNVRLELFRQMLEQDKVRGRWQLAPAEGGPRPLVVTIRRSSLLEDAFTGLASAGCNIKTRLHVHFVNAQGVPEAGIDHGGLMKELLELVVSAGCQPEYGLFAATEGTNLMYPNPAAEAIPQGLALLQFIGMMVGKALYEGILLNLSFAPCFVLSLQGGRPGLDDLAGLDSQLYSNLLAVKACPAQDVESLGLTFAVEQQLFGKTVQTDLVPGGGSLAVTGDNRLLYVHLLADHLLNTRLGRATAAFASGLSVVLPASWLRMFSPSEINQLISGGQAGGLDVEDMARYARYSNGYTASSHTVKLFWRVVSEMSPEQRSELLRFITSTSRAPLGGFKHLQPPLTIHRVDCGASPLAFIGGKDIDRLPTASTCYNMLKLPNYKRAATMKQKLLYAIGSGAGFELS